MDDLQRLLRGDAFAARDWLKHAVEGGAGLPGDFDWYGFAEGAAHNAGSSVDDAAVADAWAGVALVVYERLAAASGDAFTGFTFELSAMNLKARLISRFGQAGGHPVRDYASLVSWFLRGAAPMSFDDVERAARNLRQLPVDRWSEQIERVRSLRRIKNRLNVFRWLQSPAPPAEIRRWLTLWDLLP
jgi:hypothetical protein